MPIRNEALYFTAPRQVALRREPCPAPGPGQVRVRTRLSAISPGTEMLLYRGQMPSSLPADEALEALAGPLAYPLKYGYAAVGQVTDLGPGVPEAWAGRWVFAFQPHQTCFVATVASLHPVPTDIPPERAAFLPNMETAVNFLLDGAPLIGERVAVLGQGVVGLLTTALLARFPLAALVAFDRYPLRRETARALGATLALDPAAPDALEAARVHLAAHDRYAGADLTYELSGNPAALNLALALTGFAGRVVIGSWYGTKRAALDLGGRFHRSRIRLLSSQVTTLAPEHTGRWDKARRLALAWEMLRTFPAERLITHRIPFAQAAQAYRLLDAQPDRAIQVILTYDDAPSPAPQRG